MRVFFTYFLVTLIPVLLYFFYYAYQYKKAKNNGAELPKLFTTHFVNSLIASLVLIIIMFILIFFIFEGRQVGPDYKGIRVINGIISK